MQRVEGTVFWWELRAEWSFPGSSDIRESACSVGDLGLIPGLGRSPWEENGCPLRYSCLENPMHRAAGWATVRGVAVEHDWKTSTITFSFRAGCFALSRNLDSPAQRWGEAVQGAWRQLSFPCLSLSQWWIVTDGQTGIWTWPSVDSGAVVVCYCCSSVSFFYLYRILLPWLSVLLFLFYGLNTLLHAVDILSEMLWIIYGICLLKHCE